MNAWLNGTATAEALATHRGLHYGDGVFRTCLVHGGNVVELARQLDKLMHDASRLDLKTSRGVLEKECAERAATLGQGVLKILLLRSGGERGYRSRSCDADRLLCTYALPQYRVAAPGIRVERAHFQLATQTSLAGIKHLNRLEQVLASRAFTEGVDELLLDDDGGRPACGTRSNLFWASGGVLRTPPVDRCGVAGVTRDRILEAGGEVEPASYEALEAADELFVCNSLIGIWPVAQFGARRYEAPGPLTRRAMAALKHPLGIR